MRWKAVLLLLRFAAGETSTCSARHERLAEETQTVSFFQQAVSRKHDVKVRTRRRAPDHDLQPGELTAHGPPLPSPSPLQTVAGAGKPEPEKQGAPPAVVGAFGGQLAGDTWPEKSYQDAWISPHKADHVASPLWEDIRPKFPEGSDIWNVSLSWANVTVRHPTGVVSNIGSKKVMWADVSYISLDSLYIISLVAYPAIFIFILLALTVLASVCMAHWNGNEWPGEQLGSQDPSAALALSPSQVLSSEALTPAARRIFAWWSLFCRTIPAWMVFGTPSLLIGLTYPYPQEVFMLLVVVSSVMVFSNGLYMVFFCPLMLLEMRQSMAGWDLQLPPESASRSGEVQGDDSVVHWVVLPNYKEDVSTMTGSLESIARSPIARKQICVLLAMEERELGARQKAELLKAEFAGRFREVAITYHAADLPNDPPGKASNMASAFRWLCRYVEEVGQDPSLVVLTVADADSDFHPLYFHRLGRQFARAEPSQRFSKIWQAPVFHVKNYHRQPMLLIVGTMFTAMSEIAVLSDPYSIRFPYSTYSLPLQLARRVGGWDAEWIAEDWHMGIKCFLLTLGEVEVEPVLLPTVNYMPEVTDSWFGTINERWKQAKRHSLGFSDMSYYFMMLPILFCRLSAQQGKGRGPNLQDFWRTFFHGIAYIVRLVNTHVVVGIMTLYMIISFILKNFMYSELQDLRHVGVLFDRATVACGAFFAASLVCISITTLSFQGLYASLKDRMEPPSGKWKYLFSFTFLHWVYTFIAGTAFAAVYCTGLAASVWIAAVKVLLTGTFEYEVAAKPTKEREEQSSLAFPSSCSVIGEAPAKPSKEA